MRDSKTNGVYFNDDHTYYTWGLMLTNVTIGMPAPKTNLVDIPGADGSLDLTEALTGEIPYENRTLTFEFATTEQFSEATWANLLSTIAYQIHGKRIKINLDEDREWYYMGRCQIDTFETNRLESKITIVCDCDPYKYDINSPGQPWLWDPFSFVDGIIYNDQHEVNGTLTVEYANRRKRITPTFICSVAMTLTFKGVDYSLKAGENIIYDITFGPNETVELTFTGNGTVSIAYEEGIL